MNRSASASISQKSELSFSAGCIITKPKKGAQRGMTIS